MLAGVLLGTLAKVRDTRHAFDHVEEERTTHRRRRRLGRIPENVSNYLPLDGPLIIITNRRARVYRRTSTHRSPHNPGSSKRFVTLDCHSAQLQAVHLPAKVEGESSSPG